MQQIKTIDKLFYRTLGNKIRSLRENAGLTQLELARKIGTSRTLICAYENGYTKIKEDRWKEICKQVNKSPNLEVSIKIT